MATVLDDYEIVTDVPTPGGMGVVYRARRASGELTALKLIPLDRGGDTDAMVRSERRGAEVQRLLSQKDSHVPKVYDVGEKHGVFFIEMQYVAGEDLSTVIGRTGGLAPRDAAAIAFEVASFLDVAHNTVCDDEETSAGLVHSDLKPSNIRIVDGTGVKILDFGIARAGWHTATTNQFGSVPYMSPERIEGRIDRHVDYWALGVVLYEMLAGRLPYTVPDGPSHPERLQRLVLSRQPAPPLPATAPADLAAIVAKLLRPQLSARYQTAAEIKHDLDAFLHGRPPAAAREFVRPYEGDTIVVSRGTAAAPAAAAPRRGKRRRIAPFAGALLLTTLTIDACAVRNATSHLAAALSPPSALDPDAAWARYEGIRQWAFVPWSLRRVRPMVRDRLLRAADRVFADFRGDAPSVRAADWASARDWLEHAVALDSGDLAARARLACAAGHVLRIKAEGRRGDAQRDLILRDAIQQFENAARLDPAAPDAYLGLARVYSFGSVDFDRALAALTEAERRGQPIGRRGHAQLGDASRARGDRFRRSAATVRGLPEEPGYLRSAVRDYEQALAFYARARDFGLVAENMRVARRRLAQVRQRLADAEQSIERQEQEQP